MICKRVNEVKINNNILATYTSTVHEEEAKNLRMIHEKIIEGVAQYKICTVELQRLEH